MKNCLLFILLLSLLAIGCNTDSPGLESTGPEPVYVVKFLS
jgi:hypothetical protein